MKSNAVVCQFIILSKTWQPTTWNGWAEAMHHRHFHRFWKDDECQTILCLFIGKVLPVFWISTCYCSIFTLSLVFQFTKIISAASVWLCGLSDYSNAQVILRHMKFSRCCDTAEILALYLATQFTDGCFKWHEICSSWPRRFGLSEVSGWKFCIILL